MKKSHKFFSVLCLFALLTLTVATPVLAFEGREGDIVVIEADEVIEDDLYVGAEEFTLEGTIKGDLFVVGNVVIINGTVEGDLFAGANSVIINGTVMDDVRIGGAALDRFATPDEPGRMLMMRAGEAGGLTARGWTRTLRLARTIADLDGATGVLRRHVAEALIYRRTTVGAQADFDRRAAARGGAFGLGEAGPPQTPFLQT